MERRDKEQVKAEILDAVIRCKYEAGGKNVQVTQIAARAGISTRTLNRYYPDKDEMIYLAAIRFLDTRYASLSQAYYSSDLAGKTGMERIRFFLEMHVDYYRLNLKDATMVDSAHLRYTLGSIEEDYPKIRIGLDIRKIFLTNVELGKKDGSVRQDLNARNAWVMVASTYNGLLQRLAYLNATKCEIVDREAFFAIYNNYIDMIEQYLSP